MIEKCEKTRPSAHAEVRVFGDFDEKEKLETISTHQN